MKFGTFGIDSTFYAAVVILCFLCTITTRFEYELKSSDAYFDYSIGKACTAAAQAATKANANPCKSVGLTFELYNCCDGNDSLKFLNIH